MTSLTDKLPDEFKPHRRAAVVLGTVTAAFAIPLTTLTSGLDLGGVPWVFGFHGLCLLATIPLYLHERLGSQLLARAFWWQTLLFGSLLFVSGSGHDFTVSVFLVLGTLTALIGAGRQGLIEAEEGSPFQPVAFRRSLLLALILALADTVALFLYAGVALQREFISSPWPLLAAGCAMLVGLHGMYRLKLWGVALNLLTNLVVAGLILTEVLDIRAPLNVGLVATAVAQLLLPIPMLRAIC